MDLLEDIIKSRRERFYPAFGVPPEYDFDEETYLKYYTQWRNLDTAERNYFCPDVSGLRGKRTWKEVVDWVEEKANILHQIRLVNIPPLQVWPCVYASDMARGFDRISELQAGIDRPPLPDRLAFQVTFARYLWRKGGYDTHRALWSGLSDVERNIIRDQEVGRGTPWRKVARDERCRLERKRKAVVAHWVQALDYIANGFLVPAHGSGATIPGRTTY